MLWQDSLCRVVRVDEPDYPGFVRVILKRHAREMGELSREEREALMAVVFAVEAAVSETMQPDKMNLASLGNMTPHVHWHVVPRYDTVATREFAGKLFIDDRHGQIFRAKKRGAVGAKAREAIAAELRQHLPG